VPARSQLHGASEPWDVLTPQLHEESLRYKSTKHPALEYSKVTTRAIFRPVVASSGVSCSRMPTRLQSSSGWGMEYLVVLRLVTAGTERGLGITEEKSRRLVWLRATCPAPDNRCRFRRSRLPRGVDLPMSATARQSPLSLISE